MHYVFACKKSSSGTHATYPTVGYTLHTNFENQIYDYSHSSVYVRGTGLFDNFIYWDNRRDGSVLIYIGDTSYAGHALINLNILNLDDVSLAEPEPTMNGTFNLSGTVSNGNSPDSVDFSSSGTFTNMPYC